MNRVTRRIDAVQSFDALHDASGTHETEGSVQSRWWQIEQARDIGIEGEIGGNGRSKPWKQK